MQSNHAVPNALTLKMIKQPETGYIIPIKIKVTFCFLTHFTSIVMKYQISKSRSCKHHRQ